MPIFMDIPRFPDSIAEHSRVIPGYLTDVLTIKSGHEGRAAIWDYPRNAYDVGYGIRSMNDIADLLEFFHSVKGQAYGFRFKDWSDYKTCNTNQTVSATDLYLGTGDGSTVDFYIYKPYTKGSLTQYRFIQRIVDETEKVSIDDVETEDYWLHEDEGFIRFITAPAEGEVLKCGFEFDVPVRFDTDFLEISLDNFNQGSTSIPLIEIRP